MRSLRWASPSAATAYFELRDVAPRLSGLMYSPTIPDSTLQVILDWSEGVVAPDADPSFGLDRLRHLFPALVVAFVGEYTYARAGSGKSAGGCIDLYDRGCGTMVAEVMSLTATLATALHGDEAQQIVTAARAELADHLDRIAALIFSR
jgi:hypothetical protein